MTTSGKITPEKGAQARKADERRADWKTMIGPEKVVTEIEPKEWRKVLRLRRSGAVDARGTELPEKERSPVGDRTLEAECRWLRAVFNFGVGEELIPRNPLDRAGFEIPAEENPRRELIPEPHYRTGACRRWRRRFTFASL